MKINKDHFIAQANAAEEALSDMASLRLSPLSYGIVPASAAGENTCHIKITTDNQNTLTAIVHSLQAITPGGFRINFPGLPAPATSGALQSSFPSPQPGGDTVYWLVITVQPFDRQPCGNPDASENPARYPFTQCSYQLSLIGDSQYLQYAAHPYALIIGKIFVLPDNIKVDEDYIPPCMITQASPDLVALLTELRQFFAGLELRCAQIVQKIFKKSQQNDLSELAMFLCDRILLFIGQTIPQMSWKQLYEPPSDMLITLVSLARIMKNTIDLRTGSGKEELMNYLSEWCELNPGELEQLLTGMANLNYNHNDINSNIAYVIHFVKIIGKLFESLSNLEFIGKRKESGIFVKEEPGYNPSPGSTVEPPKPRRRFFG